MHFDFFDQTGAIERVRNAKKPGRKHQHKARGRVAEKQRRTPMLRQRLENARRAKWSQKVAAFWRGERETYPGAPRP